MTVLSDSPWLGRRVSLAQHLVLLAVLPALLASMLLLALTTVQYLRSAQAHTRDQAQTVALQLAAAARDPLAQEDRRALLHIAQTFMTQPRIRQVRIWSGEGELLAGLDAADGRHEDTLPAAAPVPALVPGAPAGQVTLEFGLDELRAIERGAWATVLAAAAVGLTGVLMAGIWAARRIGAPVRALAQAVEQLSAGHPAQVEVDTGGAREVRQLQQGFNAAAQALHEHRELLAERIRQATAELAEKNRQSEPISRAKTRLMAAASHDLRQPLHALALISGQLAVEETEPARLERIRAVRACVASLDHMFAELLDISQIDSGQLRPRWTSFELDAVFAEIERNFRPVAEENHLRLILRSTHLQIVSDYAMLVRIVGNLVANALQHTRAGGVLVAARQRGAHVRIDVVDTGSGIAPEHQQRIFEEFYQLAPAARGIGQGASLGLGLATVQRLTELLGAQLRLTSTAGRGTWVRVELPERQPDA
jgi:signal transduction histidine kinase